nr:PREDICTED: long-chain-fatty-acid--CoA ligase 1 [Lepisosteus oculatus]
MQAHELLRQLRVPELGELRQYVRSLPTNTLMGFGAFAAVTTYWYATRPRALKPPCDLSLQSVEIEGGEYARRSVLSDSGKLMSFFYSEAKTMYEIFQRGVRVSNNGPCLGSRKPNQPYEWLSYQEVADRAEWLGSGLLHRGLSPTPDQFIGIFAQNRPEWLIAELACYTYSMVSVPLYDTLGTEAIKYIIEKATISTVICDVADKARLLLDCVSGAEHPLKTVILMEAFDAELVARGRQCGVEILSLKDVEALGRANLKKPVPPKPDDLAVICFTSGTTGNPKGAMLTHENIVSNCSAFTKVTESTFFPCPDDVLISFLPLAHMFERVVEAVILCHGARIGFFQGDIRLLMDDLKTLRPTLFPVVPRLLNRMFDRIFGQANTPVKRWLLEFASKRKEAELRSGIVRNDSMWDKLIFSKVQVGPVVGVQLLVLQTGVMNRKVAHRVPPACSLSPWQFYEGYGQTECTAGITLSMPGDWTAGHVGAPLPCNVVKLVDVPEMNYFAVNGEGEVSVRVLYFYVRDPGDRSLPLVGLALWRGANVLVFALQNGTLKIIDRKKHIFKLAQGEYIAPEKVENIYNRSEPVAQVFVHGDSLQACLVAIVVPDPDVLPSWARKRGVEGSYADLCKSKEVKGAILEDMVKRGKEAGLKSFEQVRDIALHPEMFSVQNGLLTPTLKAKRMDLRSHFREQIEEMYARIKM